MRKRQCLSADSALEGGFPHSSVSKESACSAADPGLIPGSGRSPGEGNGNSLQYPCLENPMDRGAWWAAVHGVAKSWAWLSNTATSALEYLFSADPWQGDWTPWPKPSRLLSQTVNKYILRLQVLGVHWKDWCWSWNFNTLATSCEELTRWKRLWCWKGLGAGGEGDDRGWDGWMASTTQWVWVWVTSGSLWWTGRPGLLRFIQSQRVRHDWVTTELNWDSRQDKVARITTVSMWPP